LARYWQRLEYKMIEMKQTNAYKNIYFLTHTEEKQIAQKAAQRNNTTVASPKEEKNQSYQYNSNSYEKTTKIEQFFGKLEWLKRSHKMKNAF